ncbi:DUF3047 domain-containing protein [Ideonella sp. BN130291]|uniref:DUF3047 domain-containing protein n=1 Tax=Ideonella sp. BN130291 TaxID=3112940 RepID=UPI002E268817|nr:DUF3047 domain-containing protein [Ideonella sp. BN130291]
MDRIDLPAHQRGTLAAVLLALAACAHAADALTPWSATQDSHPPAPWHVSGLPHQSKPFTRFAVEPVAGTPALRVEADRSYGNLLHPLAASQLRHLSWRWTMDEPNLLADLHHRSGEDVAVRVCVLFDMPLDKVPLADRAMMLLARGGEPVPGATVCYIWDQKLAPGTALHSPYTGRIRMLVLRGAETPLHQWVSETRDLAADFKRLFGDEADTVPPIMGVLVGGDADNTQSHSLAHVGPLQLVP